MSSKGKKILIIYTGGTIGMMHHHKKKTLVPLNFSEITNHIPELKHIKCKIHFHSWKNPIDSSNVDIRFWQELVSIIQKNYTREMASHTHLPLLVLHHSEI